jgi:hypothetical protein
VAQRVKVERLGREAQPVIVIALLVPDPGALRARAEALPYQPLGRHYPGLRAEVAPDDVAAFMAPINDLIAQTFGFSGAPAVISAG